jgi:REP element-mobilizing transposase RayT
MQLRHTSALHAQRWSNSGTTYFVTCCTRYRAAGLTTKSVAKVLRGIVALSDATEDTVTHGFTIMPDHLHWLFTLGNRLSLGRVVARLKAKSKDSLVALGLAWQRDFFEHRLRPAESIEPYGLYVFLNPYRADLLSVRDKWAHWWCPRSESFGFILRLNPAGTPPMEWIGEPIPEGLATEE